MKRILLATAALALFISACGAATETAATSASTVAPTSTTAASTTTTTLVPETTTTTSTPPTTTTVVTSQADKDEIISTYEVVFSSETTFEEKSPLLEDPDGLEETVLKYQETGDSMGGVSLEARTITVDGDTAEVIYDLLFGGTPTYPDLTGDAVRVDGVWKVTRTMFCSIMASARVGCPAP